VGHHIHDLFTPGIVRQQPVCEFGAFHSGLLLR
jgi:hypothetical protein